MLSMLREQGVETVVATPHFYANQNTPEVFLRRRAAAWEHLRPHLTSALPHVLLGAEVHYFQGISRVNELQLLCLAEHACSAARDALFCLSSRMLEEITALSQQDDLTVVLAHVERYLADQPHVLWPQLRRLGILFQCNASFFLDWRTRYKAIKMLKIGKLTCLAPTVMAYRIDPAPDGMKLRSVFAAARVMWR